MSRLLPDTHMLIWLADDSPDLPRTAADLLRSEENDVFFSLASIWEISIKFALRKPHFVVDPRTLRKGLLGIGFNELPITGEHVIGVSQLPDIHRDPFDRLLVAQAKVEGLVLMTTDKKIAQYGPHVKRF
ncbi:MAG: type II toxin-antitoxin system VapC family toxin [Acidobacteria bacterium]|nr:type II toxin-antitoxin system VapC family toxin [Acidobacteriota bacterium]